MEFTSGVLTLEVAGPIATLWLDREESRNAFNMPMWHDLARAAAAVAADTSLRALVVAARGPHFSVGLDLKELNEQLPQHDASSSSEPKSNYFTYDLIRTLQDSVSAIATLPIPVIAAVHGYCIGAGVDLISACDIRLAAADAIFSAREARMAMVADLGTLQRLPGIIGAGHVAELAFTGKDITAQRAAEIGLINSVHASGAREVHEAALALANDIAANSPLAVRGTKAVLAANEGRSLDEGLEFVARWNSLHLLSHDLHEALTAFLERRRPIFKGD